MTKDGTPNSQDPVIAINPLGFPWRTEDPFLFSVHHLDHYPAGNEVMGPQPALTGRRLGMDFAGLNGWSMYHGRVVPGFPQHPHRGFETISIMRRGYIDHSDSLGATARIGAGDVQWMTAGRGIVHAEMFPLLDPKGSNDLELFQIWINLPAKSKMVAPHFKMFWRDQIPTRVFHDEQGRAVQVQVIAGELAGAKAPTPPPHSWASQASSHVAIYSIRLAPGAKWALPADVPGLNRVLYHFTDNALHVARRSVPSKMAIKVHSHLAVELEAGATGADVLVLQGRPIGEPIARHGPFVMNTRAEIQQAYADYRRTQFGRWPWPKSDPVHKRNAGRFARHADGREEKANG
ncbi:MAG: pirin family protein [Myxococcales bacterium]|nr:pirin family protein [Myxococcales bacterium]